MPYKIGFHKFNPPYWTPQQLGSAVSLWLSGDPADPYQGALPTTITKNGSGYVSGWTSGWGSGLTNTAGSSVQPYVVGNNNYVTTPTNTYLNGQDAALAGLTISSPPSVIRAFFMVATLNIANFSTIKGYSLLSSYRSTNANYLHSLIYLQSDSTQRFQLGHRIQTSSSTVQLILTQPWSNSDIFNGQPTLFSGFINNQNTTQNYSTQFQASSFFYNQSNYGYSSFAEFQNITVINGSQYSNFDRMSLNTIPGGDSTVQALSTSFNCHEILLGGLVFGDEFDRCEGYLAWKYGISLPTNGYKNLALPHPYAYSPPLL